MKNCDELRQELALTFEAEGREIKPGEAAELANLAGKMIGSAKVQVDITRCAKKRRRLRFLRRPCLGKLRSAK